MLNSIRTRFYVYNMHAVWRTFWTGSLVSAHLALPASCIIVIAAPLNSQQQWVSFFTSGGGAASNGQAQKPEQNPERLEPRGALELLDPWTFWNSGTLLGALEPLEFLEYWKYWNLPWNFQTLKPSNLQPSNLGTLEPWNPKTSGSWEPWHLGILGTLEPWNQLLCDDSSRKVCPSEQLGYPRQLAPPPASFHFFGFLATWLLQLDVPGGKVLHQESSWAVLEPHLER